MVIPLPAFLIDLLLALSISLALVILMVSMYTQQPLEFSTFPSVLLVVTLFRLALNVASTRLILLHGHEGSGAAGHVIRAFGNFVVGGGYGVGRVVFLLLVVLTFAGIIVARAASGADLGSEVAGQLLTSPRVLWLVSGILGAFALLPGLPFLPFIVLAGATGGLAAAGGVSPAPAAGKAEEGGGPAASRPKEERSEVLVPLDLMELEVGFELVPLVEPGAGSACDLVERIRTLRRNLAPGMGFIVPPVHIRDNLQIRPSEYVILLK